MAYQTFRSDLETYIEYAENQVQWEAHIDHIKEFRESHDVHFDANEYNSRYDQYEDVLKSLTITLSTGS